MTKSVLVIAAHPDDDVLGCGGTIARHVNEGDNVSILLLADGEGARGSSTHVEARKHNCISAAACLGVSQNDVIFCNFADNQMDSVALLDIIKVIEGVASKIEPEIIYTHHHGDLNIDHVLTHKAVMTAFRPMPDQSVKAIYGYEVLSSSGWASPYSDSIFTPQHYVDISSVWDKKLKALEEYDREMRPFPHARSFEAVEAQAIYRGSMMGLQRAEAFSVIRQISN